MPTLPRRRQPLHLGPTAAPGAALGPTATPGAALCDRPGPRPRPLGSQTGDWRPSPCLRGQPGCGRRNLNRVPLYLGPPRFYPKHGTEKWGSTRLIPALLTPRGLKPRPWQAGKDDIEIQVTAQHTPECLHLHPDLSFPEPGTGPHCSVTQWSPPCGGWRACGTTAAAS